MKLGSAVFAQTDFGIVVHRIYLRLFSYGKRLFPASFAVKTITDARKNCNKVTFLLLGNKFVTDFLLETYA